MFRNVRSIVFAAFAVCLGAGVAMVASASAGVDAEVRAIARLLDDWHGQGDGLEQARQRLDRVLRAHPDAPEAHRQYARYYLLAGGSGGEAEPQRLALASAAIDRALAIDPDYAPAFVLRGLVEMLAGRNAEAHAALDRAEQLGSDDPWLHFNRAEVLFDQGRHEEGLGRCKRVDRRTLPTSHLRAAHDDCMLGYYRARNDLPRMEQLYRSQIAEEPDSAWPRVSYARFLLCRKDDADAAAREIAAALKRMDYGYGRLIQAAAQARTWAAGVEARAAATLGQPLTDPDAAEAGRMLDTVIAACGDSFPTGAMLRAFYRLGAVPTSPAAAIQAAAAAEGRGVPGIYAIDVVATGRDRGRVYLNSELDYRDPRTLTLVVRPAAAQALAQRFGAPPDEALKTRRVVVVGWATREKIVFSAGGQPTDKYYYQTHVEVWNADQVVVPE